MEDNTQTYTQVEETMEPPRRKQKTQQDSNPEHTDNQIEMAIDNVDEAELDGVLASSNVFISWFLTKCFGIVFNSPDEFQYFWPKYLLRVMLKIIINALKIIGLSVPWNKMVLKPIIEELNQNRVVLASRSPSRKELLELVGFKNLDIMPSSYDENLDSKLYSNFDDYVQELALQKILDVERIIKAKNEKPPVMILGSDTIVTLNGKVYGKPKDKKDAFLKLKSLSGKTNIVYTGVAVKLNGKIHKFSDSTRVQFDNLSDERIWEYIETGEPMDKAGGYAIQGFGSTLVEKIDGNIHTVAGFPLFKFTKLLLQHFTVNLYNS